jgi:hypothetical protein
MPDKNLNLNDADELAELLQFIRDWTVPEHDQLNASLTRFVANTGYNLTQLRSDLDRFTFLLGGNDGEALFQPQIT